jgi:hypothetical protein
MQVWRHSPTPPQPVRSNTWQACPSATTPLATRAYAPSPPPSRPAICPRYGRSTLASRAVATPSMCCGSATRCVRWRRTSLTRAASGCTFLCFLYTGRGEEDLRRTTFLPSTGLSSIGLNSYCYACYGCCASLDTAEVGSGKSVASACAQSHPVIPLWEGPVRDGTCSPTVTALESSRCTILIAVSEKSSGPNGRHAGMRGV